MQKEAHWLVPRSKESVDKVGNKPNGTTSEGVLLKNAASGGSAVVRSAK